MAATQTAVTWKEKLDKALHEKNAFTDVLAQIESKTKVQRLYLALGLVSFIGLYLMVGYGAQFLCNFVGFLYPAYCSIKAIESKEKDDDTKWLTYWVVYSSFALVEFFADIVLFWVPFYWFLKCLFLAYCMVPTSYNGSVMIYTKIIKPYFLKYEAKIDRAMDQVSEQAEKVLKEGEKLATEAATSAAASHLMDDAKTD